MSLDRTAQVLPEDKQLSICAEQSAYCSRVAMSFEMIPPEKRDSRNVGGNFQFCFSENR
jgi:hypothetical protein